MKIKIESYSDDITPFLKILEKYNFEKIGMTDEGYITLQSIEEIFKLIKELDEIKIEGMADERGVNLGFYEGENFISINDGYY
jgi:hypothetical protein